MVLFPHAKINLGLYVLRQRADGYRDIATAMLPIALHDMLEILPVDDLPSGEVVLTRTGRAVPGDPANDLCVRAYHAVDRTHPLPGMRMHLHKVIPIGAGLGGGSSDAAQALLGLNAMIGTALNREQLQEMARELGSDVPFFLTRIAQLATGRGEILRSIEPRVAGFWLHLVDPGIHVSTADVYANTALNEHMPDLEELLTRTTPDHWAGRLENRMETYVFREYPEIGRLKATLMAGGACYASMSGSGSSVYGLFPSRPEPLKVPDSYAQWILEL